MKLFAVKRLLLSRGRLLRFVIILQYYIIICKGTTCFQCNNIPYTGDQSSCSKEVVCSGGQICHVSLKINDTGQVIYHSGCIDQQMCTQSSSLNPDLIGKRDVTICQNCCSGNRCNHQPCHPHGGTSEQCAEWGTWESCDVTCGGGKQTRARLCKQADRQSKYFDTRSCNTQACPSVSSVCTDQIDDCSSADIKQTICGSDAFAIKYCQKTCGRCPVDGQWSDWSRWTACTSSCGSNAHRIRLRLCNNPVPSNNGANCVGESMERVQCNIPCPVNGAWSMWTLWSRCSVTCGYGQRSRHRACDHPRPEYGGIPCNGSKDDNAGCQDHPCPVDGQWSNWSSWHRCSVTCGGGTSFRTRTCSNPMPKNGGQPCSNPTTYIEKVPCNKDACAVDGNWADWSPWHPCSVTCGGGTTFRSRTCSNPYPRHGGKSCQDPAAFIEKQSCSHNSCPEIATATPQVIISATPLHATTPKITTSVVTSHTMTSSSLVPSTGCNDQSFCSDPHISALVCQDVYVASTYCPKLCGICGSTMSPPPCVDSVGGKCGDSLYLQFACPDKELAALCAKSCGVCH